MAFEVVIVVIAKYYFFFSLNSVLFDRVCVYLLLELDTSIEKYMRAVIVLKQRQQRRIICANQANVWTLNRVL